MSGMFRGGHKRPTFDTPVEFISINQTATDKSGGYGEPVPVRGEWGAPEIMAETTVADRDAFAPTGDSGVQATSIGMFAWYTENNTQTLMLQRNDISSRPYYKERTLPNGPWGSFDRANLRSVSANRQRDPMPLPIFVEISEYENDNIQNHLPPIFWSGSNRRAGILIDDATGQSLYYCNDQLTPPRCEHYRRAIDDGLGPASRIYMADVKDIASAERVVGDLNVATTTKSLVFAHATLKPLLTSGSLAKDWKVRIGGRDMDITQVMDGWVPNRYARLVVEDRS